MAEFLELCHMVGNAALQAWAWLMANPEYGFAYLWFFGTVGSAVMFAACSTVCFGSKYGWKWIVSLAVLWPITVPVVVLMEWLCFLFCEDKPEGDNTLSSSIYGGK